MHIALQLHKELRYKEYRGCWILWPVVP